MAREFVKDLLKAPGTAEFGGESVKDLGNGEFEITGWVDSQNSFGALLRADFKVKIRHVEGNKWKLVKGPALLAR
jgi:hypothetical protein